MRVVIIEDEQLASKKLSEFVERYDREIKIVAKLESVRDSFVWFGENRPPDLIFSDIELLDGNVFGFFENNQVSCPIIFTTAYDQFWMPAFEHSGIAYLLKPFDFVKFVAAMKKFETLRQNFVSTQNDFWREIKTNFLGQKYKERFVIKVSGGIRLLESHQIVYIQMRDETPCAFDTKGKKFPLKDSLTELEKSLDPKIFFRLNRSEIVNINFIERLQLDFRDRLTLSLLDLKSQLTCSTSRTPLLRRWLESQ